MSQYPNAVYQPRTKLNKEGVEYNPDLPRVGFAEDVVNLDDEVVAIENELGPNPKGEYENVAERLITDPLIKNTPKVIVIQCTDFDTALTVGDYKYAVIIPEELDGYRFIACHAKVKTASTSGSVSIQINDDDGEGDMLTTNATIAATYHSTFDQNTGGVVRDDNNIVQKGHLFFINIDSAGTGAKGLYVMLSFEPA